MEYVIIHSVDNNGQDEFMCLSGERVETEPTDTSIYPFEHAVTLRLSPDSAARIGQEIITVSETEILQDCEIPKATELPTETQDGAETQDADRPTPTQGGDLPNKQLTLFGDEAPDQLTIF